MRPYTRSQLLSSPVLGLTITILFAVVGCGNKQGNTVGRDPKVPISMTKGPSNETSKKDVKNVADNSNPSSDRPNNGAASGSNGQGGSASDNPPAGGENPPVVGGDIVPGVPNLPRRPTLTIQVNNLHNTDGNFCLSIFNSPDGFPDSADKAIFAECFEVNERSFTITLTDFPAGRFAIAGWHDENKDKELNKNLFGIPKEGLSFSENGKPKLSPPPGPPSFDSIAFDVGNEDKTTEMKTSYLLDL